MIISIFLFFSMKSIARWSQRIVSMSTFWERDILADVGEHVTHAVIQLKFKHFSPWVSFARFIPFLLKCAFFTRKRFFFTISSNTITMETCWKVQFLCDLQEKMKLNSHASREMQWEGPWKTNIIIARVKLKLQILVEIFKHDVETIIGWLEAM